MCLSVAFASAISAWPATPVCVLAAAHAKRLCNHRRFWMLLGIVAALHAINTYRDAHKLPPDAKDLPDGAQRRLNDGRVLMADGSILKGDDIGVGGDGPTTLHKIKEKGEDELVLDRAWRKLKESV